MQFELCTVGELAEHLRTTGQRSQDNRGGIIGPAFSLGSRLPTGALTAADGNGTH